MPEHLKRFLPLSPKTWRIDTSASMEERGKIRIEECFIDGTFASAKKGALPLALRNAEKAQKSWPFRTRALFLSPSLWPLLLHMKSRWWRERLPKDLPKRLQGSLWLTGHTTPIRLTKR